MEGLECYVTCCVKKPQCIGLTTDHNSHCIVVKDLEKTRKYTLLLLL